MAMIIVGPFCLSHDLVKTSFVILHMFNCQVRVDLTGDATQRVFDKVLTNLARSAPPIPGFRREKGGNALLLLVFIIITLFEFTVAYVSFFLEHLKMCHRMIFFKLYRYFVTLMNNIKLYVQQK